MAELLVTWLSTTPPYCC